MFDVSERLRGVAKNVLNNVLAIKSGEVAVFYAGVENLDIAYAFAAECESRGIETVVQSEGDYLQRARLLEAPIEVLEKMPRAPQALAELADWFFWMNGTRHGLSIYAMEEHHERAMEVQKRQKWTPETFYSFCAERGVHMVGLGDPNLADAEALGKSYEETKELFLGSLDVDYEKMSELGTRIIEAMKAGGEIHMTCPRGTDLTLRADDRLWMNDDGRFYQRIDGDDTYTGPLQELKLIHNLPAGEVCVAPIETSAKGVAYLKDYPGSAISGLSIEFRGKRDARLSAEKGSEFLENRLKTATGNPFRIAEFAFGTNPCGDQFLATEKAYGTCHIAIGGNDFLGGTNKCSIHWDSLIERPTVTLDGKLILKDGEFKV